MKQPSKKTPAAPQPPTKKKIKRKVPLCRKKKQEQTSAPKPIKEQFPNEINGVTVSKLEMLFKQKVMDKLKVDYVWQWEQPTKRVYDFFIPKYKILIEIQGGFYHASESVVKEQGFLYANQKRQIVIDEQKRTWAMTNGYIFFAFWEDDIKRNPKPILAQLRKIMGCDSSHEKIRTMKKTYSLV